MGSEMDFYTQKRTQVAIHDHPDGPSLCRVCNDLATGKHYGGRSCDACKVFFRRSVRDSRPYTCSSKRNCEVDRENRNVCRYCRLQKCFMVGMQKSAVRSLRDENRRTEDPSDGPPHGGLDVKFLHRAEMASRSLVPQMNANDISSCIHTLDELYQIYKKMIFIMHSLVGWAKAIPAFHTLSLEDQVTLIRSNVVQNFILTSVRQSMNDDAVLTFPEDCYFQLAQAPRPDQYLSVLRAQIIVQVTQPLNSALMDDIDFACLRAIVFFNPHAQNLEDKVPVRRIRSQIQENLHSLFCQNYIQERFGELLLVLPNLHEVSLRLMDLFVEASLFNVDEIGSIARSLLVDPNVQVHVTIQEDAPETLNTVKVEPEQ